MSRLLDAMGTLNRITPVALLWANAVFALLIVVAHGGALLLYRSGKAPKHWDDDVFLLYITVPAALLSLVIAAIALRKSGLRVWALKIHAVVLVGFAIYALYSGIEAAVFGVPQGANFAWNPLVFAGVVAYPVYLAQRMFVPSGSRYSGAMALAPLWALGISILLSAVVLWRVSGAAT